MSNVGWPVIRRVVSFPANSVLHRSGARSCHCIGIRLFYMGMGVVTSFSFAANIFCREGKWRGEKGAERRGSEENFRQYSTAGIWNYESETSNFRRLKRSFVFIPQRLDVECFSFFLFFFLFKKPSSFFPTSVGVFSAARDDISFEWNTSVLVRKLWMVFHFIKQ